MGKSVHRMPAYEVRKISHPVFPSVEKYWLTVAAKDFPSGISTAVNARDPVGLNRMVYKDVRESLEARTSVPGSFDLMNKGITILAKDVKLVDKENNIFLITVDDEEGGIVDGAHTAKIIERANEEGTTPVEQHVEVYVRTGIQSPLATDIARGLNTGIQVAPKSIYNLGNIFDWLKEEIEDEGYKDRISWRESDDEEYDVRDLIGVLEVLNIFDYPNDCGKHPISAYEKWSVPLEKFAKDFEEHENKLSKSKYYRLRGLLKSGLIFYDRIRRDFRDIHSKNGGVAAKMNIVEEASARRGNFDFPFSKLADSKYRLTKGATYPILAAFRNFVEEDSVKGQAVWRDGFGSVLKVWEDAGPELVAETFQLTKDGYRNPDQIGKNRRHWSNLHTKMQNRLLRSQLQKQKQSGRR